MFAVRGIEIEECPDCGERLFSPEAMDQIAIQQPRAGKHIQREKVGSNGKRRGGF